MAKSPAVLHRQAIERKIVAAVIDALLENQFSITINNGGEEDEVYHSTDRGYILSRIMLADDDRIIANKGGKRIGWVYAVYGNDGWDVICDYTTNLDPFIGDGTNVQKLVDGECEGWVARG